MKCSRFTTLGCSRSARICSQHCRLAPRDDGGFYSPWVPGATAYNLGIRALRHREMEHHKTPNWDTFLTRRWCQCEHRRCRLTRAADSKSSVPSRKSTMIPRSKASTGYAATRPTYALILGRISQVDADQAHRLSISPYVSSLIGKAENTLRISSAMAMSALWVDRRRPTVE